MKVLNIHMRKFPRRTTTVLGTLLDQLASAEDGLWPKEAWPAMRFDRPLGFGANGGHGPIRYFVSDQVPGRRVEFEFVTPKGFDGSHRFELFETDGDVELIHTLAMTISGAALVTWPLLYRPLHDALIEDALAKAQQTAGFKPDVVPWSLWVRLVRTLFARGRPRAQSRIFSCEIEPSG